jgi:hypothetical protein
MNSPNQKEDQSTTHHAHKQQATKVLSEAMMTKEEIRMATLEKSVAELQNDKVELLTTIGEMKDNQHRDQTKLIGLQTQLELTNSKTDRALVSIEKCNTAIGNMETKLASLSTAEVTKQRFDRIESMLYGLLGAPATARVRTSTSLTGKRKEDVLLLEEGEEETFADSQEIIMETVEQDIVFATSNGTDGTGNHTNRQSEEREKSNMRLK